MRLPLFCFSVLLACTCLSSANAADAISPALKMAIADPGRAPDDIARDKSVDPADAIAFAGIKPGQDVAELAPGDGYYSRILSILTGSKGAVYLLVPFTGAINADTLRKQTKGQDLPVDTAYAVADIRGYENMLVLWEDLALDGGQFALPKQADVVWMSADYSNLDNKAWGAAVKADAVDKAILAAMKPGAVFVVPVAKTGGADAAKKEITAAGFAFDAQTDVAGRTLLRFKKPANMTGDKRAIGMAAVKELYGNTLLTGMDKPIERHLFYHPDGTYQELGKTASLLQEGYWFIDAAGRLCILHQYPRDERGYNFCELMEPRKVGERWQYPGRRGPEDDMIQSGFVYMDGTKVTPMKP
jgi:predicted methyltransferase